MVPYSHPSPLEYPQVWQKNPTHLEKFIWNYIIDYFKVKDKAICSYTMISFGDPYIFFEWHHQLWFSTTLSTQKAHLAC